MYLSSTKAITKAAVRYVVGGSAAFTTGLALRSLIPDFDNLDKVTKTRIVIGVAGIGVVVSNKVGEYTDDTVDAAFEVIEIVKGNIDEIRNEQ